MTDWLLQQIEEDLLWATEASRRDNGEAVEPGVHWQWETNDDRVVEPDPGLTEIVGGSDDFSVSLRSKEVWPTASVGPLPQFAIHTAEEVASAVGGHIVRHDPARVIRDLRARLVTIEQCIPAWRSGAPSERILAERVLRGMVETYAERSGYRPEWKTESEK